MRYSTNRLHQHFSILLMATLGTILLATSFASADSTGQDPQQIKSSMAQKAKITIDQAISTASKAQPGRVIKAELEKEHGPLLWELEIVTEDGKIHEIHVDGERGEIFDLHAQKGTEEKSGTAIHTGASDQKSEQGLASTGEQAPSTEEPITKKP